jgi:hypothetical protein
MQTLFSSLLKQATLMRWSTVLIDLPLQLVFPGNSQILDSALKTLSTDSNIDISSETFDGGSTDIGII